MKQARTKVAKVLLKQYLGRPEVRGYLLELVGIKTDLYSSLVFLYQSLAANGNKGDKQAQVEVWG